MGVLSRFNGVFYGYWVLLGCFLIHAVGSGAYFYGFSVFYTPLLLEFGWSSTVLSGAFSLSRLEGGLEGPLVGWLIERYGSRKLLIAGVIIAAIGFIAMTFIDSIIMMYLVYAILLSVGYNLGFTHAMVSMVTNWFIKKRSRAMSIYAMAAGVGGAVMVPLMARSISVFGWRMTAVICGVAYLVVGLPVSIFLRDKPEDMGLLPDDLKASDFEGFDSGVTAEELGLEVEYSFSEALRSGTFWTLTLAESFRSFLLGSIVIHQIPYLVWVGVSPEAAAGILGLMVTLSIPGRLIFGSLGDFIDKRKLLIVLMGLQALGIFIFSQATGTFHAYVFVVVYGVAYGGAIPLLMSLRGELFGRRRYASVSGFMAPFRMVGGVVGPMFAGYIWDVYHDYRIAFYAFAVLAILSALTFFFVRPVEGSVSGVSG